MAERGIHRSIFMSCVMSSLKDRVVSSLFWSTIGLAASSLVSFVCNIVLARQLTASDFGCIGMLAIFLSVSQAFIDGGFTLALIQKKDVKDIDYSTIFYWNLFVAVAFVCLLYFVSPLIADFYHLPLLKRVLRVQSLDLIITSLAIVPISKYKKELRFKPLAIRNIASAVVGTVVAITMAYNGFGVWSLVASTLSTSIVNTILLWLMLKWKPKLEFSIQSWKSLFSFGGMMLLTNLVNTIYSNSVGLIVGRRFSAKDLGYYTQAKKIESMPSVIMSFVINQVTFPTFSLIQDDKKRLVETLRYNIKTIAFLSFPLLAMLMSVGDPLIRLVFSDRWLESVPYFQVLCLSSMLSTLVGTNKSVVQSLGKGRLFFRVELSLKIIGLGLLLWGMTSGVMMMVYALVLTSYISFAVFMVVNRNLLGYSLRMQVKDLAPYYVISLTLAGFCYWVFSFCSWHYLAVLCCQATMYGFLYLVISKLIRLDGFTYFFNTLSGIVDKYKIHR